MINTNKTNPRNELIRNLQRAVNNVFANTTRTAEVLQFVGAFANDSAANLETVDAQFEIEEGPRFGKIHTHGRVMIAHKSRIRIDTNALKQRIVEEMAMPGVSTVAVFVKHLPLNEELEKRYRRKNPVSVVEAIENTPGGII